MENRNENADGVVVACTMKYTNPKFGPRLYAALTPQEWRGVVSVSAIGSRTPEQVIKAAIREYLERRHIIIEPKIAPGGATRIRGENRVLVMSRNGAILRQFVCTLPGWAFDALQFAAENDEAPIGQTCAAAIYHFAAHRGIEPPRRRGMQSPARARLCGGESSRQGCAPLPPPKLTPARRSRRS